MAEYKVVEVTHFATAGDTGEGEPENFRSVLREYCSAGWEIVSTKLLAKQDIQRALVVLAR